MEYEALNFALKAVAINHVAVWNRLKVISSEDVGLANPYISVIIRTLEKNYYDQIKNESRFLFLTEAIVLLCRSDHNRMVDNLINVVKLEGKEIPIEDFIKSPKLDEYCKLYDIVKYENKDLEIPYFAYDKHTYKGRAMGRGWEHFFNEGCKLANEVGEDPYLERHKELRLKGR